MTFFSFQPTFTGRLQLKIEKCNPPQTPHLHRSTLRCTASLSTIKSWGEPLRWGPGHQTGTHLQRRAENPNSAQNPADLRSRAAGQFSRTRHRSLLAGCRRCLGLSVIKHLPKPAALVSRTFSLPPPQNPASPREALEAGPSAEG